MREQAIDPPEYEVFEEKYKKEIDEFVDDFKNEIERMLKRLNGEDIETIMSIALSISDEALCLYDDLEEFKENKNGE